MIIHDGVTIPKYPEPFDPDANEWVTAAWDDDVACHGSIVAASSVWVLPDNWTEISSLEDVAVSDCDGTTYDHANQILLSTTETNGTFTITNRTKFADQTVLDRSVKVKVKST